MLKKNNIIVFEGIDGSGKKTQSNLFYNYCKEKNIPAVLMEFPRYEKTFFGKMVGEFLNGNFGNINQVHPKLVAILYAGDRFETLEKINCYLKMGYTIICDRYVPSNIAHQIAKVPPNERPRLAKWIEQLEYEVFKLPRPDLILFLDLDPSISSQFILKKDKRLYTNKAKDIHEKDEEYLRKVYKTFKNMAKKSNWITIDCNNKNIETIHNEIIKMLKGKI